MIRRLAVGVLLTGAVACGVVAVVLPEPAAPAGSPASRLATPAWSPRRLPQPFVDAVGAAGLQAALEFALGTADGCFAVLSASGPVASRAADVPYIGASTQKLLTGAAALAILGPDATLSTRVLATGGPGSVDRLVLVGGGDPYLATPELRATLAADPETASVPATPLDALADAVVAAGVTRVGTLVVDDARYDAERYLPVWPASYRTEGQVGPIGALTVNHGFRAFRPPDPVEDPAIFAGEELARLLRDRGVEVGAPQRARVPDDATEIARVDSVPIRDVVADVVRSSDNLAAEMLVKEVGVRAAGAGTTAAGVAAVTRELGELGIPMEGVTLVDGSGLARDNRITCRALAGAVDLGADPAFASLWSGMAVAGESGTLADEFLGTGLEGRLRGKTGFLNGVTGLAGIVDLGRPVRFAFVVNGGFGESQAIRIRGDLGRLVARFPDAPPPGELVPAPTPPSPGP